LAHRLIELGAEIVSTGGTAAALRQSRGERDRGFYLDRISRNHGRPGPKRSIPKCLELWLGLPDNPEHKQAMATHGITPFDLIAVNLYPFEKVIEGQN